MKKIKLDSISVGYLTETVIKNLSLEIEEGEFVGIFGPNGAGKTTLLCAINGLAIVKKGRVFIDSEELNIFSENRFRRIIGYVPQHFNVDPKLPVLAEDVVYMGCYGKIGLFKFPGKKENQLAYKISTLLEIEPLLKKPFGQLSGGERKRVLIARALMKEPEILLLDEIFAWLDIKMMEKVLIILKDIHKKKHLTTILVSHDIETVKTLCSRIIWMENGGLIFDGKKEAFLKKIEAE
ncbi:MAG: metal ABC transporter ATP-binding protein [Candidatus Omnitrophica bacterium]|nr:metal ABC transporter ATP-binding protein [Candidatus Omnitrophota bacterium]